MSLYFFFTKTGSISKNETPLQYNSAFDFTLRASLAQDHQISQRPRVLQNPDPFGVAYRFAGFDLFVFKLRLSFYDRTTG